jgi:hypothetical protein
MVESAIRALVAPYQLNAHLSRLLRIDSGAMCSGTTNKFSRRCRCWPIHANKSFMRSRKWIHVRLRASDMLPSSPSYAAVQYVSLFEFEERQ